MKVSNPRVWGKVQQWFMRTARKLRFRQAIQGGRYLELLKADRLGEIIVGDLLKIDDMVYLYVGMNEDGGPGQEHFANMGYPTPQFIPAVPQLVLHIIHFDLQIFPRWEKAGHLTYGEFWGEAASLSANS